MQDLNLYNVKIMLDGHYYDRNYTGSTPEAALNNFLEIHEGGADFEKHIFSINQIPGVKVFDYGYMKLYHVPRDPGSALKADISAAEKMTGAKYRGLWTDDTQIMVLGR